MVQVADTVIAVSPGDAEALSSLANDHASQPVVIPNLHDMSTRKRHGNRSSARWDLLFVGGFLHEPNTDAVRWLLNGIVPRLPLNRYRIAIVGHGLPRDLADLADSAGVEYLGEVETLEPIYASTKASIAPLRFGAGVKGKVIEAALHGLPVVATDVAWESIDVSHGVSGLVANDEAEFASAITSLLDDEDLRSRIVDECGAWLSGFSIESYSNLLRDSIGMHRA